MKTASTKDVIIITKRPKGHAGFHGGAWKVAYADFVTAMMAFFMVMWLISQNNAVKEAVASYFRDPGAFESTANGNITGGGKGTLDAAVTVSVSNMTAVETARKMLRQAAQEIADQLSETGGLKGLDKQVEIQVTDEGMRVELVDSENSTFFDSGSATIKPETERILLLMARELGKLSMSVTVEGHTDTLPYSNKRSYSNWELSSDRANAARRILLAGGLAPEVIGSVRGYADRRLRLPEDPLNPHNRRVSIVVPVLNKSMRGR